MKKLLLLFLASTANLLYCSEIKYNRQILIPSIFQARTRTDKPDGIVVGLEVIFDDECTLNFMMSQEEFKKDYDSYVKQDGLSNKEHDFALYAFVQKLTKEQGDTLNLSEFEKIQKSSKSIKEVSGCMTKDEKIFALELYNIASFLANKYNLEAADSYKGFNDN